MFLISKVTPTAQSVTFSNIPSTYADLCLYICARDNRNTAMADVTLAYNSGTVEDRIFYGNNNTIGVATNLNGGANQTIGGTLPAANATAGTFSGTWIYMPQYLSSQNKAALGWSVGPNASTSTNAAYTYVWGSYFTLTTAVTSLTLGTSSTFVSGTTICLYGIKNS